MPVGQTCAAAGMVEADPSGALDDPVVTLQERLAIEINVAACQAVEPATDLVEKALRELRLTSWTIEVREPTAGCVIAVIEPTSTRVLLIPRTSPND